MAYNHRVVRAICGHCGKPGIWRLAPSDQIRRKLPCSCNAIINTRAVPKWPAVPRSIYIGPDRSKLLKLYPVPPDAKIEIPPYSVRSFVYQTSRELGGCYYEVRERGHVYGDAVFYDLCSDPED